MTQTELKSFADELGMKYIGNDFDFHLKKIHHIRNFEIGHITSSADGREIEISLYEPGGKNYIIKFNTWYLIESDYYYQDLDRNMQKIPKDQVLLRARLRVQSALLKVYEEKDAQKKNYVGRYLINIELASSGKLIWR